MEDRQVDGGLETTTLGEGGPFWMHIVRITYPNLHDSFEQMVQLFQSGGTGGV